MEGDKHAFQLTKVRHEKAGEARGGLFSRCKNRHNVGIENGWKIF